MSELTTDQKGAIAESEIASAAIRIGIGVYKPMFEGARYDLIFEVGTTLMRIQCKWARLEGEVVAVRCYSCRRGRDGMIARKYTIDEIDAIAAYCPETDRCCLLPPTLACSRRLVHLCVAPSRNNQRSRVNWADDFLFEARLEALLGP